jgi:hypothetical protein
MKFSSKKNFLLIWLNVFTTITFINPFTPTILKIMAFISFLITCYQLLSKYTVTLEEDHLIYEHQFLFFTIFHKYIPYKSVEKVEFEYDIKYLKLHTMNMKSFYFEITTPEFIYAAEKLCEKQQIPYEYVVKQKNVRKKEVA